jgi:diadenosine tetraphosphate (Ap4A) HIT family hydrolase
MSVDACIFCEIAARTAPAHVVWAGDDAVVFLERNPMNPGHLLVVPREHVSTVWELDEVARRIRARFEREFPPGDVRR